MSFNHESFKPVLDASDRLNRAKEILEFVIDWHTKDREQQPGIGWILAEVQTGIIDALARLDQATSARQGESL